MSNIDAAGPELCTKARCGSRILWPRTKFPGLGDLHTRGQLPEITTWPFDYRYLRIPHFARDDGTQSEDQVRFAQDNSRRPMA